MMRHRVHQTWVHHGDITVATFVQDLSTPKQLIRKVWFGNLSRKNGLPISLTIIAISQSIDFWKSIHLYEFEGGVDLCISP